MNAMTEVQQKFVMDLAVKIKSHDEWLAIINFGMKSLLDDLEFFMQLILIEASRMESQNRNGPNLVTIVPKIMAELKVRLVSFPGLVASDC